MPLVIVHRGRAARYVSAVLLRNTEPLSTGPVRLPSYLRLGLDNLGDTSKTSSRALDQNVMACMLCALAVKTCEVLKVRTLNGCRRVGFDGGVDSDKRAGSPASRLLLPVVLQQGSPTTLRIGTLDFPMLHCECRSPC